MPRVRFRESSIKRDALGRFAKKAGSGKKRRYKPGVTNAQRRELGRKKLKAANVVRGHEAYKEQSEERVRRGKSPLAGIANTEKQLPKAQERLDRINREIAKLQFEDDEEAAKARDFLNDGDGKKKRDVSPGELRDIAQDMVRLAHFNRQGNRGAARYQSMSPEQQDEFFNNKIIPLFEKFGRPEIGKGNYLDFQDAVKDLWRAPAKPTGKSGSSRTAKGLGRDRIRGLEEARASRRGNRAKPQRPSQLRRELDEINSKLADMMSNIDFEAYAEMSREEKDKIRAQKRPLLDRMHELDSMLKNIKPDRSVKLSEAVKSGKISDVVDTFVDRNPHVSLTGWDGEDSPVRRMITGVSGRLGSVKAERVGADERTVAKKIAQIFQSFEKVQDKYPDVQVDGLNAWPSEQFSHPSAIAHCRRGALLFIDFNVDYLGSRHPAGESRNSDRFHPVGFEDRPWGNAIIHEFGHAVDWVAHGFYDECRKVDDDLTAESVTERRERNLDALGNVRSFQLRNRLASAFVDAGEPDVRPNDSWSQTVRREESPQNATKAKLKAWLGANMSKYSFTDGNVDRGIMNDDEAIAEAFMDIEHNGRSGSSVTSRVLYDHLMEQLEARRERLAREQE